MQRGIDPMTMDEAISKTLSVMREDYLNSKRKGYWQNPKSCGFIEHEYEHDVSKEDWKSSADHAVSCLKTFYQSDLYEMILSSPKESWLEIEKLSTFQLEGNKVYVALDFSFFDGEQVLIYDWKTGTADPQHHELQLACYSYYAIEKWKVQAPQVRTIEFNLAVNRQFEHQLQEAELANIKEYILGSIRDMKNLLDEPEENLACENRFEFTAHEEECNCCNFKKLCPKWV